MYELNGMCYAGEPGHYRPLLKIIYVKPLEDYKMLLTFSTGETRICDFRDNLRGVFEKLRDKQLFDTVYLKFGTVCWCNGELDYDPLCLYEDSLPVQNQESD